MGEFQGSLEAFGDEDWVRVTLEAGTSYRISLSAADAPVSMRVFSVEDPPFLPDDQVRIDDIEVEDDGSAQQTVLTPEVGGDFFISVKSFGGADLVDYTVVVEEQADDFADNAQTEGLLQAEQTVTGALEVDGDEDWLRMPLEAGVTYRVEVAFDAASDPFAFNFVNAFSRDEDEFAPAGSFPGFPPLRVETLDVIGDFQSGVQQATFTPLTNAEYFLSISGPARNYTANLSVIADDYADNAATTGDIAPGGSLEGAFETAYDEDWVRIALEAGTTYRITAEALDGFFPPLLQVWSPNEPFPLLGPADGTPFVNAPPRVEFTSVELNETTSQVVFTPARSVEHFIAVSGALDDIGRWRLTVNEQADDFPDTEATTGVLPVGGAIGGTIETPGDEDFFRLDLELGRSYRIVLDGAANSFQLGSVTDSAYDNGDLIRTVIAEADPLDFEGTQQAVVTPRASGAYFVAVSGGFGGDTGTYMVSAFEQADDFADNADTTGVLAPGSEIGGRIETRGDADWFRLEGEAGVSYRVTVATGDPTLPVRATIETVVDDEFGLGNERTEEGAENVFFGGPVAQAVFTPRDGGSYFVQVTQGFLSSATPPIDYTVSVDRIEDDYADHDGTTAVLVPSGGTGAGLSAEEARCIAYLYEAGLDRDGDIDLPGLNFWIDAREGGLDENQVAQAFLDSPEFAAAFGEPDTLSDTELVEQLYRNVLNREGEQGGIDFWVSVFGRPDFGRDDLLLAFAKSPENIEGSTFVQTLEEVTPGDWGFV